MKKLLLLIFTFSFNAFATPNSIIAIVNDQLITFNHISVDNKTKTEILASINHQIDIILQMKEVERLGIKPKAFLINDALKYLAKEKSTSVRQLKSSIDFGKVIKDIKTELSIKGLRSLVLNKANISLTQAEINTALGNSINTADNVIRQIRVAQIVIDSIKQTDSLLYSEDELIKIFLTDLYKKIRQGESFYNMAKLYSQDVSSKYGGESDWITEKYLPKVFTNALQFLEFNELSTPFKAVGKWRIIKSLERRVINKKHNFKDKILKHKEKAYLDKWMKELRANSKIEIFKHKL
jgi:peptidyl-prolyl cis-trans isomerase SurA